MAGDTEEPRSAVAFAAYLGIRLAAHQKNRRCGRNRLRVVDHRRSAVESNNGREGGLDTRNTTLAFERLHQRRLFATSYAPAPVCVTMSKSTPSWPKIFLPR